MEKIKENKSVIIMIFIIVICMFTLCHFNMMAPDEYNYSNIASSEERVTSLSDILTTQNFLYSEWTGRIPAHTLIQLFLLIGGPLFDILNAVVFIIFILLIIKILYEKITVIGIGSVLALVLFVGSVFWSKFIWLSGSINYLWMVVLMLNVIYNLYNIIIKDKDINIYQGIFLLIVSFLAGWSQENTAFVLGSFIAILYFFNIKKIFKLDVKKKVVIILSAIMVLIGASILFFAPGNYVRLGEGNRSISLFGIMENIDVIIKILTIYFISVCICFIVNYKKYKKEVLQQLKYFIFPIIIAFLPMLIIPVFPARSMLPYETIMYICIVANICSLAKELYSMEKKSYRITAIIVTIIILVSSTFMLCYYTYFAVKHIKPYENMLLSRIEETKNDNKKDIVIKPFDKIEQAKKMQVNLEMFPDILTNQCASYYIARYYGLDSVIAVPEGMTCIEVEMNELDNNKEYKVLNKNTGEILANRILELNYGFYAKNITNIASFCIKTEDLENATINIPIDKIKAIKLKNIKEIRTVDTL